MLDKIIIYLEFRLGIHYRIQLLWIDKKHDNIIISDRKWSD